MNSQPAQPPPLTRAPTRKRIAVPIGVLLLGMVSGCLQPEPSFERDRRTVIDDETDTRTNWRSPSLDPRLRVEAPAFFGTIADVTSEESSRFWVQSTVLVDEYYAEIELRAETSDGFSMMLIAFDGGLDLRSLVPGETLGATETESGYDFSPIHVRACAGGEDGNWTDDVPGDLMIDVKPSQREGFVLLEFQARLWSMYGTGPVGSLTGSMEVAVQ